MHRPKIIILEGVSGCGKSALLHPVNEFSNYLDVVTMRFTPSMWVYNKVFKRETVDYESMNLDLQKDHDVHTVWLQVDPDEAYRRKRAKNDNDRIEKIAVANYWYEQYFNGVTTLKKVHQIDTTGRTEEAVLREIGKMIYDVP